MPVIELYPHSHPGTDRNTPTEDPFLSKRKHQIVETLIRSYNLRIKHRPFVKETKTSLQDGAPLLLLVSLGQESSPGGSLEDLADTLVGARRALKVLVSTDLLANLLTLIAY